MADEITGLEITGQEIEL